MTILLSVDTSTEACSAALYVDGHITSSYELAPKEHTRLLIPMCDQLLKTAGIEVSQLSAIAFGKGPGSFTGVRIACAVAQGIAFSNDLPLLPVSTLQSLSQKAFEKHGVTQVLAGLDARMQEVYWGSFVLNDGIMELVGNETVESPDQLSVPSEGKWFGAGNAWKTYKEKLQLRYQRVLDSFDEHLYPDAKSLFPFALKAFMSGRSVGFENAQPEYLRNNIATQCSRSK